MASRLSLIVTLTIASTVALPALSSPLWCSHMYDETKIAAAYKAPGDNQFWRGPLQKKLDHLAETHPNSIRWIEDAQFQLKYKGKKRILQSGKNRVLLISTADKNPQLIKDYLAAVALGTLSLPMSQNGSHLFVRFGEKIVDAYETQHEFLIREYLAPVAMPRKTFSRIEPLIELSSTEFSHLQSYFEAIRRSFWNVLGRFNNDGTTETQGQLDRNLCVRGGGHNCTTFLTAAPIGPKREPLFKLLELADDGYIPNNPGWLVGTLSMERPREREGLVVLWTDKPIETALRELEANENIVNWSFDPYQRQL